VDTSRSDGKGRAVKLPDNLLSEILFLFSDVRYAKLAVEHRASFNSAVPFPHVVIDDFLPVEIAQAVYQSYPAVDSEITHHDNQNTSRKLQPDAGRFSPALRAFSSALSSREFLLFMETLTGIDCLIPDPYFFGGGAMISEKGDFLNIHQDFNWHFQLQLHRRVNALFYLTPDWKPEYGGNLELFDHEKKVKEVVPLFNRVVIFSTPGANHGQPVPVSAPEEIQRRVFSAFFYTSRPNEDLWNDPHFTKYLPTNFQLGVKTKADYEARGSDY
jgi:Rps23 Pro-64 3,4-dihydroxylase Tpa1-like proline 4-hydroxylase